MLARNAVLHIVITLASIAMLAACGGGGANTNPQPPSSTARAAASPASTPRLSTAGPVAVTPTERSGTIRIEALLQPQGPTIEASARIEAVSPTAPAEVIVTAKVSRPGVYPIHLHGGTCRQPGASVGFLGTLVPGGEGRATFSASAVALPGGATTLTLELLERNEVVIDIHDPAGAVVACAELRRGGQQ